MRRTIGVLLVVLVLAAMSSVGLAYEWGTYDLGGNTVSFVINWDILTSYFGPEATYAPGRLEEAEKLFNCKFEWVNSGGDPDEVMNARLMAGESAYDFWAVGLSTSRFFQNAAAGWYCPVTNVIPQDTTMNSRYPTDRSWKRSRSEVRSTRSQPLTEPL